MMTDYRVMFDANPDAIFILDAKGRILNANLSAIQRYGYSLEELRQMNAADLSAQDMKNKVLLYLQKALKSGEQFEWLHRCKDGSELAVEIYSSSIIHQGEYAILANVRDITRHKTAEATVQRLTKLYAALSQCNQSIVRCSNIDELFPIICHDAVQFGGMKMA